MPLTRATVILPAYNEASALPTVLADLYAVLDPHYEIIVVDDGSTDETAAAARAFPCHVVRHKANRGKGAAVRTGIHYARGDFIVVMDADATYPAEAVPRLVDMLADCDLVRCSRLRNTQHMPVVNRIGNLLFDLLLGFAHGLDGSDHLSGLYGLRREALMRLRLEAEGFDLEAEIGIKARIRGLRVKSFTIPYSPRMGEKKLRPWRDGVTILGRILALFLLYNPLLTFVMPGFVVMLLTLLGAALLSTGPLIIPQYFGLGIHSFIITTLGILASFQLITFGMAAALYGMEAGYRPARWLIRLSSRPVRLGAALLGFMLTVGAVGTIVSLVYSWLSTGAGLFFATREVVLSASVMVLGLQILSAALFLSIFAGRLERLWKASPQDVTDETYE
jgi:glycosyltransferase involved in cell wall biosynthesis